MNKRQYKKYCKKLKSRSYYTYRYKQIEKVIDKHYPDRGNAIVYIEDSKRGDLKHFKGIYLLRDFVPVSVPGATKIETEEIVFECNPYRNETIEQITDGIEESIFHRTLIENGMRPMDFDGDVCLTDELSSSEISLISKMMEVWKEGISNKEEIEK